MLFTESQALKHGAKLNSSERGGGGGRVGGKQPNNYPRWMEPCAIKFWLHMIDCLKLPYFSLMPFPFSM